MTEPTYFPAEADFRRWLKANHERAPELLVGFWKKGSGKPSIDWPQARDQALCFGWIDGVRRSLGDEAYTIRFTPRRKGSIWSKVNVDRFAALKADGQMTAAGERAYEENKHKSGLYSYEKPLASLEADEERQIRNNSPAWAYWETQPAGLPQDGAELDHHCQAAGNPCQAARDPDRGLRGGAAHCRLRLAQEAVISVTGAAAGSGPTKRDVRISSFCREAEANDVHAHSMLNPARFRIGPGRMRDRRNCLANFGFPAEERWIFPAGQDRRLPPCRICAPATRSA